MNDRDEQSVMVATTGRRPGDNYGRQRRPDIALFLTALSGGGAERVMLIMARKFAQRGLEVDLVLSKAEGPYVAEVPASVRMVDLGARHIATSLPALAAYICRERPQAMLSTLTPANVIATLARHVSLVRVRQVVREAIALTVHANNAPTRRWRLLPHCVRWLYRHTDGVVAVSRGVADNLARVTCLPREQIKVIYNPVDIQEIWEKSRECVMHPWFAPNQLPVVLAAGRLTAQKDFRSLIGAFSLLRGRRQARLVILGDGEERACLQGLVKGLDLCDAIDLPGFVENPFAYMVRSAVFVLSSAWEGFPNVLVEAMACGTPVVATDCESGPAEILEGGKWGRLVPVGHAEDLARGILSTLDDRPGRAALKQRAAEFSVESAVAQYLDVLGVK